MFRLTDHKVSPHPPPPPVPLLYCTVNAHLHPENVYVRFPLYLHGLMNCKCNYESRISLFNIKFAFRLSDLDPSDCKMLDWDEFLRLHVRRIPLGNSANCVKSLLQLCWTKWTPRRGQRPKALPQHLFVQAIELKDTSANPNTNVDTK